MSTDAAAPRPLTDAEHRLLAAVLDELIPARPDGRLPAAGRLGVAGPVDEALCAVPMLREVVVSGLAELDAQARQQDPRGFEALDPVARVGLLHQQGFVFPLLLQVYAAYYRQPAVLEALGLEARAPHPAGHEMPPDDLGLLERVRRGPRRWRAV